MREIFSCWFEESAHDVFEYDRKRAIMAGVSTKCFHGKKKRSPTAVLIPQGDVSDIDLDDSDDDEENVAKLTTSKKLGCHEGSLTEIGLDVEIDDDEEDGSTDNAGFARAGASGFIYGFDVYVGKKTISQPSELGISGDIVLKLTEPLPSHKGFKVAFDNWFTSHGLIVALKEKGLLSVGTARVNRLPGCSVKTDAALKKSGRGSFDVCTEVCNNIAAVKWLDNKPVHLVSSYIGSEPVDQVQRWSATTGSHVTVQQPAIVKEYNRFMGGVDLCNMLVELYRCDIRGRSPLSSGDKLPSLGALHEKMVSSSPLTPSTFRQIVDVLHNEMAKSTLYPTRLFYSKDSWKVALLTKCKNLRRKLDDHADVVASRQNFGAQRKTGDTSELQRNKTLKMRVSITGLTAEDDDSVTKHEDWLVLEAEKPLPNEELIEKLMALTAGRRLPYVPENTVRDVKKYPYMMDFQRVRSDDSSKEQPMTPQPGEPRELSEAEL
ncbi:hypothetical protein MTO96_020012 [Rhipicephalus appendiculatus]